jgi:TorA maturation chaperone TorD
MVLPDRGETVSEVPEEDLLRAQLYQLLARFLAAPPGDELIHLARGLGGDDATDLGRAMTVLSRTADAATPEAIEDEYNALFIGVVRGELLPYASYYLTGFLNEKPLANVRRDMAAHGIERAEDVTDPEDHMAALSDMMAGLITGAFGAPATLAEQKAFFEAHIAPWGERFYEDLEAADSAVLYMPVGTIGRVFMGIEATAFQMVT